MSGSRGFVDTSVLVYAYDRTAGDKHERAKALVAELWDSGEGCLSVQVLQEFFVSITRKVPKPLDADAAKAVIADLAYWQVHQPGPPDVLDAIDLHRRAGVSFWDAMVIRSAVSLNCEVLYSEDLNPGQRYDGVELRNPLAPAAAP